MRFALLLCAAFARAAAPIDALVKAALEAHKAGDAKGALQLYRTVLRLDTAKEALSQKARGVVCANAAAIEVANGDFSGAEALLDCAVANDPSPKNLASRAAFYLAQDRLGPAEQACRAALKQDPAHAAATLYLAEALARSGGGMPVGAALPLDRLAGVLDGGAARLSHVGARVWRISDFVDADTCAALVSGANWAAAETTGADAATRAAWRSGQVSVLGGPLQRLLEARVAKLLGGATFSLEPAQLARYVPGDAFEVHYDATPQTPRRHLTVLVYLDDAAVPEDAGDTRGCTHFPYGAVDAAEASLVAALSPVDAARRALDGRDAGLFVAPKRGDAIVFFNTDAEGRVDVLSLHASVSAAANKHVANLWVTLT